MLLNYNVFILNFMHYLLKFWKYLKIRVFQINPPSLPVVEGDANCVEASSQKQLVGSAFHLQ